MKKTLFLTAIFFSLIACRNHTKLENQDVTKDENTLNGTSKAMTLEIGCYAYDSNGSIIKMEITQTNEVVLGNLNIAYAEKDANQGKFAGTLEGDKLIGTYTFQSEGTESTREIAFLVKNNQLIEGYGELIENGTKFKDVSTINYTSKMPLTRVDCKN